MSVIVGATRPPTERVAVVWSSWSHSVEWDCGDGAVGTRSATTAGAGAHYAGVVGGGQDSTGQDVGDASNNNII